MYSSQSDDKAAGPSQATQSTDFGLSPVKNRDSQGLFPLTVKQISDAYLSSETKANFVVDGVNVKYVTLVGMVFDKVKWIKVANFTLYDGTGRVDCHRWLRESIDKLEMDEIQNGMYVIIHGQLKGFQGKKHLVAFSVRSLGNLPLTEKKLIKRSLTICSNPQIRQRSLWRKGYIEMNLPTNYKFHQRRSLSLSLSLSTHTHTYINTSEQFSSHLGREIIRVLEEDGEIYSTIDEYHYKYNG